MTSNRPHSTSPSDHIQCYFQIHFWLAKRPPARDGERQQKVQGSKRLAARVVAEREEARDS
ncbi:hypothetical protein A2U01_0072173, partial [Trifolium medium]|nr:hypothetical protein [Trifolium medium]